jgi:quinol monooxygenase YgiN
MSKIALVVEFRLKPDCRQAFKDLLTDHAALTLDDEDGCLHFDVVVDQEDDGRAFLYEIYRDQAALEVHRNSPILAKTRAAYADLISDRKLTVCTVL